MIQLLTERIPGIGHAKATKEIVNGGDDITQGLSGDNIEMLLSECAKFWSSSLRDLLC